MAHRTATLQSDNSVATSPLNITARSVPPTSPDVEDIYLDDGTNYAGGVPGWRRWDGVSWVDIGGGGGGSSCVSNLDGGRAEEVYGGVETSPIDGGPADAVYGGVSLSPLDGGNAATWM